MEADRLAGEELQLLLGDVWVWWLLQLLLGVALVWQWEQVWGGSLMQDYFELVLSLGALLLLRGRSLVPPEQC